MNLFMLTSTESCDELINTLLQHARKEEEEKANFIYSIVCLAESSSDQLLTVSPLVAVAVVVVVAVGVVTVIVAVVVLVVVAVVVVLAIVVVVVVVIVVSF